MKLLSTLTAAMLLSTGAAFAASTTPTATPGSAAPANANANANAHKHGAMYCEKEAKEKKLTGDEAKKFVKECRAGKTS